jgi:hypothetical protein
MGFDELEKSTQNHEGQYEPEFSNSIGTPMEERLLLVIFKNLEEGNTR